MIYKLPNIPKRTTKPRDKGLTMMMDKGLSIRQAEDFIESSGHLTDMVKLGFGTSMISNRLEDKIKIYLLKLFVVKFKKVRKKIE